MTTPANLLRLLVELIEKTQSESEGRYPIPDEGCPVCTCNTVPDRDNTGLCALHEAKQVLGMK